MNFKKYLFTLTIALVVVSQTFAGDFYWVGNSGDWNDASHWATQSGGKGGILVPSAADNVFIDNKSFKSRNSVITINSSIAVHNLTISALESNFTIKSNKQTEINIYGSVLVSSKFENQIHSTLRFKSNNIETIHLGWFVWESDIYFEGNGTYKLTSPIQNHNAALHHVSGVLDLNYNDVLSGDFISNSNTKRTLISGKSTILTYRNFIVENRKNDFNFSETTLYTLGQDDLAKGTVGGDVINTVTSATVNSDTVSCGNVCDGTLTVSFTTTCPTATVDWLPGTGTNVYMGECFNCPIPGPNATSTITGLCPGIYTAVVRNSCDASVKAPQGEVKGHPSIVPILEDIIQTTCRDTCDGSIDVIVTGASYAEFAYQWYPIPPFTLTDTFPTVTGLCTGNYSLEVQDGFGCIDTFDYFVPEPDYIYPNVSVTDILCFGDCNGSATANPTGGNGGYTYQWSANAAPNVLTNPGITNLCIGSYTVDILDVNNCPGDTTITVSSPDSLDIVSSQIDVSCGGYSDGSATVTVNIGGVPNYTHNWSTGFVETTTPGQSSTILNLVAGTYTDSIVDANGCDTVITFVITEPDTLLTTTTFTNVKCFGANDGTAITSPFNGTFPYFYSWSCGPSTFDSIVGIGPGQCIVTVTDSKGCEIQDTFDITEPLPLLSNPALVSDMSCPGVCDGVATSNPSGGTTPYVWSWNNGDNTQTTTTGLCQGFVTVTVTDSNLCTHTDSVLISEPLPMVLTMTETDVTCNGACDGTGGVTVTGGTPGYTYNWLPAPPNGQGTDTIWGLCPNVYTVTVIDNNGTGCSVSNNITITQPVVLTATVTTTDLRCNALCEGTATITPAGGQSPYMVSWDGAPFVNVVGASNTILNLCAGNHTVNVRDANGCITPINFVINEPTPLTTVSSGTNPLCNAVCSGTATTNPAGGTSPYVYSWNTTPINQTTQTATNLCAGVYIVTITDDSLCTIQDSVTIIEPPVLDANVSFTNITCNNQNNGTATALPFGGSPGYTISWTTIAGVPIAGNPISGLSAGQYVVTVTDFSGCIDRDTITITNPPKIQVNPSAVSTSCQTFCDGVGTANPTGGTGSTYTYAWCNGDNTQTTTSGLCAGTYCIVVTDSVGCSVMDSVTILPSIIINIATDTVGISCNGLCDGTATANPSGGILPYTYLWNDPASQVTQTAVGLCPGNYTVIVTDSVGCTANATVTMPVDPSVLVPNGTFTNVTCFGANDGTISAAPTGGVPPYTLTWSNTPQTGLGAGTYWVTVTDANLCSQTDTLRIIEPDSITPNETVVHVNCNGNSTGSISLAPTGGTPGYTYLWSGGLGTNSSVSNLPVGSYTVTITDTLGCSKQVTYQITQPTVFASNPLNIPETCANACNATAGIIVSGGTAPHTTSWSTVPPQSTDTITNLCAGTYSAISIDANGCSTNQTITIAPKQPLLANSSGTSVACNGNCTGTATVAPSGGTGPYTIVWTAVGGSAISNPTNPTISNLCQDTYNATITDANGCSTIGTYIVTNPALLQVTLDSTNITCNGNNNGTATANPVGGTLPYTYSWTGGSLPVPTTTQSISNLTPGIYTVNVTDSLGCFFSGSVNIVEPLLITPNEVIIGANCGVNDGSIDVFPSGGTPTYTHSWSNGSSSNSLTGLGVGFYTDTITDLNGCKQNFTFAVSNPAGPSGVTATVNDASCFGACDGSANVIPIGGTPGYTYDWNVIPIETDSTITGQCAGTLNLTVTDAMGCVLNTFVVIGEKDSIATNSTFTNVSCSGSCDGTASVTPSGGTAPYTYLWSGNSVNGQTTAAVSGLCLGAVSVTITDFNGCTKVVNFNITSPNALTVTTTATEVNCNGGTDGTATATPLDGTSPYTYQWSDPLSQTTPVASGLAPGTYTVTVRDVNGCSVTDVAVVNEPSLIVANETTTTAACGVSDGTATVAPTGGSGAGYTYNWTSLGLSVPNVTGLAAGTYPLEITDGNGCMQTFLIPISNPNGPVITTTSTDASCNGSCTGSASVSVTSGTPNYTYLWTGGTITGQTTTSVNGLCAGTYTVRVTDGNGCRTVRTVVIGENSVLAATVSSINVTCNGGNDGSAIIVPNGGVPPYSYSWSGPCPAPNNNAVSGLCAGTYTVTVSDALNCSGPITVVINEPNVLTVSAVANNLTCFGQSDGSATATPAGGTAPYTYLWSNGLTTPTISGLAAGNYSVTVTDSKGCSATDNVTIFSGNSLTANFNTTDATCGVCDGSATINVGVGSGPYTYLWLPGGQTTPTVNNICPGAYNVDVTNSLGCTQTFNVLINNPNGPTLLSGADSVSCFGFCDGLAWTEVTAGTSPFIYQWDDNLLQTNDTATSLCAGLYNVVVQDSLGCISVDSIRVDQPAQILANLSTTPVSCNGVCDGTATVNPSGGVGSYTINWSNGDSGPTATALCAGNHSVTITDGNGCPIVHNFTLTAPTVLTNTMTSTSTTCNGDCDGTALTTVSGGTPPYTYSWDSAPIQNGSLATSLCAGLYTVTTTDNRGCVQADTISVITPSVLSTSSVVTDANCNGQNDGSITTHPVGGVAPYTFIWSTSPIQTDSIATGLIAGTYNVIVVDANGCTAYDTLTVNEPNTLNDSTIVNGPTCGQCDGSATANPVGGVGPYTYLWGNGQTGQTTTNLCAGIITLQITDQGIGCIYNYNVIVNSITGPTVVLSSTGESCPGSCDGTALASASNGNLPYSFSWNPTGQTDSLAIGLCSNFYTVTVTDAIGCITIDTLSITSTGLNLSIINVIPESCFNSCDGSATVVAGAGSNPFTYQWNPTGGNNDVATNLCTGSYTAVVTDASNCRDSIGTNIVGPNVLSVSIGVNTAISCNASCDGALIASPLGGNAPFTYLWSDGQTGQLATNLCAGTYYVVVTDAGGCTASDTIVLNEPTAILANETLFTPACNVCDGSIQLNPSGGTGPYSFLWGAPIAGQNTGTVINLCAGIYSVDITDNTGCSNTFTFPLSNTNAPDPNVINTPITCNGSCNGVLLSSPTGGTAPYTYVWSPNAVPNNLFDSTITSLCADVYNVSVTDAVGCVGVSIDTIVEPIVLLANIDSSNVTCNGLTDGWAVVHPSGGMAPYNTAIWAPGGVQDSIFNLSPNTYVVSVTDANGCSVTDSVIITEPTLITATSNVVDASCSSVCDGQASLVVSGGTGTYTYSWNPSGQTTNPATNLCFGSYTVTITDQNNCSVPVTVNVGSLDTVVAIAGNDTSVCMGNSLNLSGISQGGVVSVQWLELPSMNVISNTNNVTVNSASSGTVCYVFAAYGVCNDFDTICVTYNPQPIANAGIDVTIVEGNSTQLNATGGGTYVWTPSTGLSDTTISNPIANPMVTTTYTVTVTSPDGCTSQDSVKVTVIPTIRFPDGITPNGDGKNDTWVIDYIDQYPDAIVEIYNRWGEMLFRSDNYQNDWNGTYNGQNLPVGTYYFVIELNDGKTKPFTGPLTVLR
ncbi:MAG: gliding motility-associated C-terminal domain-containing protein [Flavobacteriales bacterium]|nr:gliding motility-associated C-terminal domain-containing protein [Flavobacteriales bacterium]